MQTLSITDAVDRYLTRCSVDRGLSPHTIDAYRRDLAAFVEFSDRYGVTDLGHVDRRLVRRYVANLTTRGYAARSVSRKASTVRAFLADAERRKLVSTEQSLGMDTEPKIPSAIEGLETFTLSGAPDDDKEEALPDAESFFNLPDADDKDADEDEDKKD